MTSLPPYTVRESTRAQHVNLKMSMDGDLEVVIPRGFNRKHIPGILQKKQAWIKRASKRATERRAHRAAQPALPTEVSLLAVGEIWAVEYQPTASNRITVTEKPDQRIVLSGAVDNVDLCQAALRKWTTRKGKQYLAPWVRAISVEEKLPFDKVTIRGQKTRWGSCSSRETISLNYKLLFLPPEFVHYVLIHELCHTKELNHSARFWALVAEKEPNYKQIKKELRAAWRYLPGWVPK